MKTCCMVAASDFNQEAFRLFANEGRFDYVVAIDAGLKHLQEVGYEPDYILGDFDSLGYVPQGSNVETHPTHKDESDLELAFDCVIDRGFNEVLVFGALGGRLDHTMAALQTCARFAEQGTIVELVASDCAVRILVGPGRCDLPALESGTVSVFSATDESIGVTERGMEYPLEGARLTNRTSLGLSNELVGEPASISLEQGTLYVFHPIN